MQDALNTKIELSKLKYVREHLIDENVFDADSFVDLIIE